MESKECDAHGMKRFELNNFSEVIKPRKTGSSSWHLNAYGLRAQHSTSISNSFPRGHLPHLICIFLNAARYGVHKRRSTKLDSRWKHLDGSAGSAPWRSAREPDAGVGLPPSCKVVSDKLGEEVRSNGAAIRICETSHWTAFCCLKQAADTSQSIIFH